MWQEAEDDREFNHALQKATEIILSKEDWKPDPMKSAHLMTTFAFNELDDGVLPAIKVIFESLNVSPSITSTGETSTSIITISVNSEDLFLIRANLTSKGINR